MGNWTPEAIQEWIFKKLYPLYKKKPESHVRFINNSSDEPGPDFHEIVREMKLLEQLGYVEIIGEARNIILARLTSDGCLYWEQSPQPPSKTEEPRPLGRDV